MGTTVVAMKENTQFIRDYFSKLGFEPELSDIYIALFTRGAQTISELARSSGVERTRIYRLADELTHSGLIEVETHYKRSVYKAAPIANIQILLAKKEQELKELQAGLVEMKSIFTKDTQKNGTRVQFYHGMEGTKQIFWNETKATSEVLVILLENMQSKTNSSFFERWVRRCNERGLQFRGIVNDTFLQTQQEWYAHRDNEQLENWQARYLPEGEFPITHSTITYDNVVVHNDWKTDDVFGLEIYNQDIADTQRRYFELLWEKARPIDNAVSQARQV